MKKIAVLLLILLLISGTLCSCVSTSEVTVDILDIGKADCILIDTGKHTVMIDTGEEDDISDIIEFLGSENVSNIDVLILSHFDKDHIGGAAELIEKYRIHTVLETGFSSNRDEYENYHCVLSDNGFAAKVLTENYSFVLDDCSFTVYVPKQSAYEVKEDNNASLIVSMEHGENRFLFCGDAMELRLSEFLEDSPGSFDFIKLPYHGNYLENYSDFLEETTPKYGVITCSKKNPASEDALALLEQFGVAVFETENGNVSVISNGISISVSQE